MATQLYFSRDTKVYIEFNNKVWEVPVLDGFSFSQGNNTSEITLNEMESSGGISRRGRRAFNDSLAPGEWSLSTYVRPFASAGAGDGAADDSAHVHAVEEVLWGMMAGADTYNATTFDFENSTIIPATSIVVGETYEIVTVGSPVTNWTAIGSASSPVAGMVFTAGSTVPTGAGTVKRKVTAHDASSNKISFHASNSSTLGTANIYFILGDANRTVMKLTQAVVNEASIDFEIDGISTISWSGQCSEVLDFSGSSIVQNTSEVSKTVQVNGTVNSGATTINLDAGHGAAKGDLLFGTGLPATGAPITAVATNAMTVAATTAQIADDASLTLRKPTLDGTAVQVGDVWLDQDNSHKLYVFTGTAGVYVPVSEAVTAYPTQEAITDTSNFIRNRLTTLTVDGTNTSGLLSAYDLTLTGGNVSVSNNVTFITPEEIGLVNVPIGHVTGTRSVTGSFTCYLSVNSAARDGTGDKSRDLFEDLRALTTVVTNNVGMTFSIGGASGKRLEISCPTAHLEIPTHSIEDVISLETSFQALPATIDSTNEVTFTYKV